ncbi:hypothetical protein BH10PAT1_BH10PAT1_2540 [soil metagenome]
MINLKNKFNERTVGSIFLFFICLYVVSYGIFVSHGFRFEQINFFYFSLLVTIFLIDSIKTIIESTHVGKFYTGIEDVSKVTVIIPTKNGGELLEETVQDLLRRFKPNRVIIASNGSTDDTCERLQKYGVVIINHPNAIGKVDAINLALEKVETPYTLIMDDDTLIGNAVIPTKALLDGYDGVAFRVMPKKGNWVTKIQIYEYRKSMDIGKRFHNANATVQNISGAIGLFPTKELIRQIDVHTGEFSGEDLQRTLLIHLSDNSKGVVISDSVIETEVPSSINALFQQRVYGWNPGLFSNFFRYINLLLRSKKTPIGLRYEAFYNSILVVSLDPVRLIALPLVVFYPFYFLTIYIVYVFTETIPWLSMQRKDPYWIILVYPFYGLFGLVARSVSMAVFFYRRFIVKITSSPNLDDYRSNNSNHKITTIFIVILFGLILISLPVFAKKYLPHPDDLTIKLAVHETLVNTAVRNIPSKISYIDLTTTQLPEYYEIPFKNGDSKFDVAYSAVLKYVDFANIYLNFDQLTFADNLVEQTLPEIPTYQEGNVIIVSTALIKSEISKVY